MCLCTSVFLLGICLLASTQFWLDLYTFTSKCMLFCIHVCVSVGLHCALNSLVCVCSAKPKKVTYQQSFLYL